MVNFKQSPLLVDFIFCKGHYVPWINSPTKFDWDCISGGAPAWLWNIWVACLLLFFCFVFPSKFTTCCVPRLRVVKCGMASPVKKHGFPNPWTNFHAQCFGLTRGSRLRFKIALLTYKVRSTSTPSYLSLIITTKRSTGYSLRSSSAPQLPVPRVNTEFARRAFRVAAPQFLNVLPVNVQSSQSVHVFKSRLKTFLLNRASV